MTHRFSSFRFSAMLFDGINVPNGYVASTPEEVEDIFLNKLPKKVCIVTDCTCLYSSVLCCCVAVLLCCFVAVLLCCCVAMLLYCYVTLRNYRLYASSVAHAHTLTLHKQYFHERCCYQSTSIVRWTFGWTIFKWFYWWYPYNYIRYRSKNYI
jgi:uncharacterized membrane protein